MLSEQTILLALRNLSEQLKTSGIIGELNLLGGTAMVLAFNARTATKDVDAIFEPTLEVRKAAERVAENLSLPMDWLNDAAKGFISPTGNFAPIAGIDFSNLRIQAPTPEYMLAMKVLAARSTIGEQRGDANDIAFLIRLLGIRNSDEVMGIVSRYYDPSQILPRSFYLVDEIIESIWS